MNRALLVFTLLAIGLCALMPSDESIWIDEAQTYAYASQPSLSGWWEKLRHDEFSEALMPLGMLSAWVSAQLFGLGEWQMRLPNAIWTGTAVAAFAVLGRLWRVPWAPFLFAVQPFVWFYANEARPYSLQIACGSVLAVSMVRLIESRTFSPMSTAAFLGSANLLVATSLFGVLTAGPAALTVVIRARRQRWTASRAVLLSAIGSLLWWLLCGAYYLSVLARGAKGAKLWDVNWLNIGFAFYELLGFAGLGPGRNDLRVLGRSLGSTGDGASLLSFILPIAFLGIVYLAVLVAGRRGVMRSPHLLAAGAVAGVALATLVSTLGLAFLAQFPFWGRHLAPVLAFVTILLILFLAPLAPADGPGWRGLVAPLLGLTLFCSSLLLRFHPRHAKDDYRSAAAVAREALESGEEVWWSADPQAARYYGLEIAEGEPRPGALTYVFLPRPEYLGVLPSPTLVVTTKPDAYDAQSSLIEFLQRHGFARSALFQAMTLWRKLP